MASEKISDELVDDPEIKAIEAKKGKQTKAKDKEQILIEEFAEASPVFKPSFLVPFLEAKGMFKNSLLRNLTGLLEAKSKYKGYNNEPHLINTKSGVLNIKTHQMEERAGRLFDRIIPEFEPSATAPNFERLLNNYNTDENPTLSNDLLKLFGYQLFGGNKLKTFFIAHGDGDNAKSTLWNLVANALGSEDVDGYATRVDASTFIESGRNFNVGLRALNNSRFSYADEIKAGSNIDGNLIKQLVAGSGSVVKFEAKQQGFQLTANIISPVLLSMNGLPNFKEADQATLNRVALIEFSKVFVRNDPESEAIIERARHEGAGILNLIIKSYDPDWKVPQKWLGNAETFINEQFFDDDVIYNLEEALKVTIEVTGDARDEVRRAELHQELKKKYYSINLKDMPTSRELLKILPAKFDIGVHGNFYTKILIK